MVTHSPPPDLSMAPVTDPGGSRRECLIGTGVMDDPLLLMTGVSSPGREAKLCGGGNFTGISCGTSSIAVFDVKTIGVERPGGARRLFFLLTLTIAPSTGGGDRS